MKATATMYRRYKNADGAPHDVLIEAIMSPVAVAELTEGETVVVKLWHGPCLEAEVEFLVQNVGGINRGRASLTLKKELRAEAPPEALKC